MTISRKKTGKGDALLFNLRFFSQPKMNQNMTKINIMHGQSNTGDSLAIVATKSTKAIKPKDTNKIHPTPHQRSNSKRKLIGNGKKHHQQIIVRNRSKASHPTAKGEITMIAKQLKIFGDGKENRIRSKLLTHILVMTKPNVLKRTQEVKGDGLSQSKQHDGKKYVLFLILYLEAVHYSTTCYILSH